MPCPHRYPRHLVTRRQVLLSSASVALLSTTACSGPLVRSNAQTPPFRLYLGDAPTPTSLVPLDAQTLADLPADQAVTLTAPWARFSADGSTLVELTWPKGRAFGRRVRCW
ncbi:MAG: hypothetical protein ACR2JY_22610 [Chloroflexota bacterium]